MRNPCFALMAAAIVWLSPASAADDDKDKKDEKGTGQQIVISQKEHEPADTDALLPVVSVSYGFGTNDPAIIDILLKQMEKMPDKTFLLHNSRASAKDKKRAAEAMRKADDASWNLIANSDSVTIFAPTHKPEPPAPIGVMKDALERSEAMQPFWTLHDKALIGAAQTEKQFRDANARMKPRAKDRPDPVAPAAPGDGKKKWY